MSDPTSIEPLISLSRRRGFASEQSISFLMQQAVDHPEVLSLAAGLVDPATLPLEAVRDAAVEIFSDPSLGRAALQYGTTPGSQRLREELVRYMAAQEGVDPAALPLCADDIALTTGSQQFLAMVCDLLLDPGDLCLVAGPTYFVMISAIQGAGGEAIPVEADADGMRPDALAETLEQLAADGRLSRLKMLYLVPYYDNPSGALLTLERRKAILDLVEQWQSRQQFSIVEDAAYRELRYDGDDVPSLWHLDESRQRVIYTQTFSKSFSPGLRVGFGTAPPQIMDAVNDLKGNSDFGSAHANQILLHHVLTDGRFRHHVETLRDAYRAKRDAMLEAADEHFSDIPGVSWIRPRGGLYVWMTLPESIPTGFDSKLFRDCVEAEEVMYVPGRLCFAGPFEERPNHHMRLSFGVQDAAGIREGMRRLSRSVRRFVRP